MDELGRGGGGGVMGGLVGEETLPDMLKNTPSNIRRLADEIEQCEGRHKYRAQTTSSSDGGDVRWYFCKVPLAQNELAASVPHTEIVGMGDYFRFGMRDSLAIEASFLQREEELLSFWWGEYAECSDGPNGNVASTSNSKAHGEESSSVSPRSLQLYADEEERVGVPVKGGLYEVDLVKRHCFPVYWNGENRRVLRGHWFARKGGLDWLPLREDVAEQLEFAYHGRVWHRRTFQPSGLFAARVDLQGSTPGLHALFTGEDDTWEAWLVADSSGLLNAISLGSKNIKLRRGYAPSQSPKPTQDELRQQKEEEMDDYCSQVPVRHLVFMVHGIGQRLEKSNLVDDVGNFRHITSSLAERHLTSYQRGTQRVLFIPCQWRKGLKLSGESAVERITLDGVRGLRVMLSATVHDVLYYMSPIYCQDIINSVSTQLNRLYLKFLKRNPGYDGKVSIYGHSLGSVLSYDILCHQENLSSPFPMEWMYKDHDKDEKSDSLTNTLTPCSNFTSDMRMKNLIVDECKSMESHVLEAKSDGEPSSAVLVDADAQQTSEPSSALLVEDDAQETCIPVDPPALSDSDEASRDLDAKKPNEVLLSDENICDQSLDWIDLISFEREGPNEPPSVKSEVIESGEKKSVEEMPNSDKDKAEVSMKEVEDMPDSDKDKAINILMREIDLLKAKITSLETEKGYGKQTMTRKEASPEPCTLQQHDSQRSYTPYINYTKLAFKVDTFFAVGSPLGVFLSLRNVRIGLGSGTDYWEGENINEEMPACRQMFNIFHPFDPVAYRLEPLICKEYLEKRPVIIPYHRGGKRLYVGFQEFTEGLAANTHALMGHISSVRVRVLTLCQSRDDAEGNEGSENGQEKEEESYGLVMMERLTGCKDGRVDHVLQDKTFRHPYISAIGSHTNYWRDHDTALFILRHLYRDIPEEPPSPRETSEGSSKDEKPVKGWFDESEFVEEDVPLTFADRAVIKSISRKAKKAIKR